MAYIRPEEVLSPRKHVGGVLEVIHDPGEGHMSVARIIWDDRERIATRWNGDDDAAASIEHAAREAAQDSPHGLAAGYREMAEDLDREREARDWMEGLI